MTKEALVEEFKGWKRLLNTFHLPAERPASEGDMAELWLRDALDRYATAQRAEGAREAREEMLDKVRWTLGKDALDAMLDALTPTETDNNTAT